MNLQMTYRTRRKIRWISTIVSAVVVVLVVMWLISAVWLQRYVVYSREGATVDMARPISDEPGVEAVKPEAKGGISIYYNEGSDAIEISGELKPLNGYYISYEDLSKRMDDVWTDLDNAKSGTPVMIELKGGFGTFYYSSKLADATPSASVNISQVDDLITNLQSRGFYTIAKISSLCDRTYVDSHPGSWLTQLKSQNAWMDKDGYYWLKPTDQGAANWIISIVNELKGLGFNEVLLSNFHFPNSDQFRYDNDKNADLLALQETIMKQCQTDYFTVSFGLNDVTFALPDGRSRMFLENVEAQNAESVFSRAVLTDPESRLVFLCATNDTRFDNYSVLRPLSVAQEIEALKAERAKQEALSNGA